MSSQLFPDGSQVSKADNSAFQAAATALTVPIDAALAILGKRVLANLEGQIGLIQAVSDNDFRPRS